MLDSFTNYFWQHPIAIALAAIALIIILIWMTGSGSRQRFIIVKRTKETEQLARDISRIANALEKIARQREIPMDYLDRPIPAGWEDTISAGEPVEDLPPAEAPKAPRQAANVTPVDAHHAPFVPDNGSPVSARANATSASAAANLRPVSVASNAHASAGATFHGDNFQSENVQRNDHRQGSGQHESVSAPAESDAGKKKLDLPNPLYRPK